MTTGVGFEPLTIRGVRGEKFTYWIISRCGLRGEMGEFGDYFKTWNWSRFPVHSQRGLGLIVGEVSQPGLRDALLDTNPATAFNPFGA